MKTVYLSDANISYDAAKQRFAEADQWAKTSCPTYEGYVIHEVSDFSYQYDQLAEYEFDSEEDIMWFTLRWL